MLFRSVNPERGIVPVGQMASGHRPVYDTRPKSDLIQFYNVLIVIIIEQFELINRL